MRRVSRAATLCGVLIPFWLATGVLLAGALYPGYSHLDQAMSELGAEGAPTHGLSPWLNNFPLGVLFVVFGGALIARLGHSRLALLSGVLIALHGLASFVTGGFACDVGCGLENPSPTQQIHNLAGLVMFASLFIANVLWIWLGRRLFGSTAFALFSALCALLAAACLPLMAEAVQAGHGFGLYQRLNYGVSVLWVGALAWMLLRRR